MKSAWQANRRMNVPPASLAGRLGLPLPVFSPLWMAIFLILSCSHTVHGGETNAPSFVDLTNRAWTQYATNHWAEAEALFTSALELDSNSPETIHGLAKSLFRLKNYDQAITAYQRMLALNPNETNACLGVAASNYRLKNYEVSAQWYRKYIALAPHVAAGYYSLYLCLKWQNHFKEAEGPIQRAVSLIPTNANYQVQMGYCLMELRRYLEAIAPLDRALSLDPHNAEAAYLLGSCYYRQNAYPLAIKAFERVLSLNPTNAGTIYYLGLSYYNQKDFPQAAATLQKYVQRQPTNFDGYYWLGYSLARLHRHDEAANALQKALQIKPGDFEASLGCGLNLMLAGRYSEALTNLEMAHQVRATDQPVRIMLFGAYLLSAQYQEAYETAPAVCLLGGGLLLLGYFSGLAILLRFSFKVRPHPYPGLWFSLAWVTVFFDGQLACICLLGFLSLVHINETPLTGIILAGIPVLIAVPRGFARQPWGKPFAWPPLLGSKKMIWLALASLGLLSLVESGYGTLFTLVAHQPPPVQFALPFINFGFKASPLIAIVAIVVVAPMVEEILFRGLIYGALERWLPGSWVIVTSSLFFALAHFQGYYIIPLFCMGAILGWLRWKSGSLGLPMLVHGLNNGLALLFLKVFASSH
jgi:tetratricopeptide (TPR) repeat protein/membrane protease YdiL (CAAX protease family)